MAFQPLTQQQFEQARKAGFSTDQIIANEKIRKDKQGGEQKSIGGFVKNIGTSGMGLVKDVAQVALHPITTTQNLSKTAIGGVQKLIPGQQGYEENFDQLTSFFKDRYGSLDAIKETAYKDPVGLATDLATLLEGGGALLKGASKVGEFGKVADVAKASKVAETAKISGLAKVGETVGQIGETINPIKQGAKIIGKVAAPVVNKVGELGKALAKYGTAQITGLSQPTIETILKNSSEFSSENMAKYTRENLGKDVFAKINSRLEDLRDTGKGYNTIREGEGIIKPLKNGKSPIDFESILQKNKIGHTIDETGKIKLNIDAESLPLNATDVRDLENFFNTYNKPSLSSNAVLNARQAISDLAKYDANKTGNLERISRDLRGTLDTVAKKEIPGLKALDQKYAPEVELLKKIKKDYLNADGSIKDNFYSKVANISNQGKEPVLARLEKISPGIGQRAKILKAVEDISNAGSQKVGTYARAGLGIAGITSLRPELIVAAILAEPKNATAILRGYAKYIGADESAVKRVLKATSIPAKTKQLVGSSITPVTVGNRAFDEEN